MSCLLGGAVEVEAPFGAAVAAAPAALHHFYTNCGVRLGFKQGHGKKAITTVHPPLRRLILWPELLTCWASWVRAVFTLSLRSITPSPAGGAMPDPPSPLLVEPSPCLNSGPRLFASSHWSCSAFPTKCGCLNHT